MFKKVISIVLCSMFLFMCSSVTAFAVAGGEPVAETETNTVTIAVTEPNGAVFPTVSSTDKIPNSTYQEITSPKYILRNNAFFLICLIGCAIALGIITLKKRKEGV